MRNSIIANSPDAAAWANGSKTVLIVPVKPQPIFSDGHWRFRNYINPISDFGRIFIRFAPYTIGHRIYVRESITHTSLGGAIYAADCAKVTGGNFLGENEYFHIDLVAPDRGYISAATMPKHLARTWLTPVSVECMRVQELTEEQYLGAGGWEYKNCPYHKNPKMSYREESFIPQFGQSAWDANIYCFIYKMEKS